MRKPAHTPLAEQIDHGEVSRSTFLAIQQAIELQELDNAYWIPGKENPAGGLTKLHTGNLPLLRLMVAGAYNPGCVRPLRGVAFWGH